VDVSKVPFEQTHASQRIAALFDNLVSSAEQRWWHDEIERLGRLEIDHYFVLLWEAGPVTPLAFRLFKPK
jgi:hypothetical protein